MKKIEAVIRHFRPGAPDRSTRRPRSAMERQKSNFTEAGAIAPGAAWWWPGWAKVKSGSFQDDRGLGAAARRHPIDP